MTLAQDAPERGRARPRPQREALLDQLRGVVANAREAGCERLPAERTLAASLQVSRGTLRRALEDLAREGLVQARPQSGWMLTGQALSEPAHALIGFSEMGQLYGYEPHGEVLASVVRLAHPAEESRLGLGPLSRVWELRRRRLLGRRPVSVETVVLALSLADGLPDIDFTDRSLLADLDARGIRVTRTDVIVQAALADQSDGALLDLEVGDAVLTQDEVAFDQFGREVFLCHAVYRADSYRFRSTLTRRGQLV